MNNNFNRQKLASIARGRKLAEDALAKASLRHKDKAALEKRVYAQLAAGNGDMSGYSVFERQGIEDVLDEMVRHA